MNKHFVNTSLKLAMLVFSVPALLWSGQLAQQSKTFTGEVTDSICAPSGSHSATIAKTPGMGNDSVTCTKKCVSMGAKYVLLDPSSQAMYTIEDPDKVSQFAGHKVKVTGTLNGNAINVTNISALG